MDSHSVSDDLAVLGIVEDFDTDVEIADATDVPDATDTDTSTGSDGDQVIQDCGQDTQHKYFVLQNSCNCSVFVQNVGHLFSMYRSASKV